ncbi:ribosomal protein S7 domain-containing protein [Suillus bovinus]|uniref:ribosomal protein S7 domain-containing protein n=1 Tax=Suillus bovinus TaxID=48563 RepID=UPI001B8824FC|nr:ribosomal protein S7 domain-containing protein [Suillus bovinus]KAG2160132.1 ribosomal protein S7 domain-containing protein [Suillus bovinus]
MRLLATFNASRFSCPQRTSPSVGLRRVLASRANSSTTDARTVNHSISLLDSIMGSSSTLDLKTSSLSNILSPPTPPTQKMLIPPVSDPLLHFLASILLNHGKRARAERIVSRTLLYIHALTRAPPLPILRHALITASPAVKCISQKRSGKSVVRPAALTEKQRVRAGIHAVLSASKNKSGKTVEERLAREIIAVVNGDSKAIADKELAHKQAMVNRGNALVR